MTQCPIAAAKAATPWWMQEILDYDGLEVWPVYEETDATTGDSYCEVCKPEDAHFWSVYGHLKEGGMTCFEDFATKEEAIAFAEKLLPAYPHLQELGIQL